MLTVFKGNKMTPLKIHNCGSYALMEYFTCWKCVIFHAVTASCYFLNQILFDLKKNKKPKRLENSQLLRKT